MTGSPANSRGILTAVSEHSDLPAKTDDEISLRELYLILKRGFPLMALVTVLAVAGAVMWSVLTPDHYVAEATIVSRSQGEGGSTLGFDIRNTLDAATIERLAMNPITFDRALALLQGTANAPDDASELAVAAQVSTLSGSNTGTAITMALRMEHGNPDTAAAWANRWADAAVDRIRDARIRAIQPIVDETLRTLESSAALLESAERAYEKAVALDLTGLQQRLAAANARVDWLVSDLASLDRTLAGLRAEREATPAGNVGERSRLANDIARLEGERAEVSDTLASEEGILNELRANVAATDIQVRAATRKLDEAQAGYRLVADAQPLLELVRNVTPENTVVLDTARPPTAPAGVSVALVAAVAGVVAALASILFVFLREAVRDPASRTNL